MARLLPALILCLGLPLAAAAQPTATTNDPLAQLKMQADQAQQQGDYNKSVQLASQVLQQKPDDHVAYYLRASARVESGREQGNTQTIREGVSDAREAIRYSQNQNINYYLPYLYGMMNLAVMENKKSHAETALNVANQVLARPNLSTEERANFHYQRGMIYLPLNKPREAAQDFSETIKLSPNHFAALLALPDAYALAGENDQALASFNQVIEKQPNSPVVYNNRAMFYQQQGKLQEAINDFSRAIQLDPNYHHAITNRGFAYLEGGKPDTAEADLNKSLSIAPEQPFVLGMRGEARLLQGKIAEAIQDQTRAVQLDPQNPALHSDLGFSYFFNQNYNEALTQFNQATQLAQDQMKVLTPWIYLAMVRNNQKAEADAKFQTVLAEKPEARDSVDMLTAFLMGGVTEADLLKSIDQKDPQRAKAQTCEAHYFIGQKALLAGDTATATQNFQQSLNTGMRNLSAYRGAQYALKKF
ncbi:tetratricopeptide repeat protein [Gimesia chilikensis]|uniref:tetratricopeptide repeat protein n=1 Tax=Gimesia chilikensis TaxID=2605989 RepID=UPI00118B7382|nr:tetratricopeptide repeat protein [Gimesia chilikensis]QDT83526.1 Lipoprotein NlpI precursor [Gimesia chilikensis]